MPITFSFDNGGTDMVLYIENLSKKVKSKNQTVPIRVVEQIEDATKTSIDTGFTPTYIPLGYSESVTISGYIVDSDEISNMINYVYPDALLTVTSSTVAEFESASTWEIKSFSLKYADGQYGIRKYSLGLVHQFHPTVR